MIKYIQTLVNCNSIKILIIVIVLDTIFGILRAIKEKSLNSCIGIDGLIRKVGMLITILFTFLIDNILNLNLIGFLPEAIKNGLQLGNIGLGDLFGILFILFEILSIFKNMILCKLPIPAKLQKTLEKIMKEFTGELMKEE